MAADGAWPAGRVSAPDDAGPHRAAAGVRAALSGVEARLAAVGSAGLRPDSAAALAAALEALALRMARHEADSESRGEALTAELTRLATRVRARAESEQAAVAAQLQASEMRMSARLDALAGELAHGRAIQARHVRRDRIAGHWLLAAASIAAAVSVAGAAVTIFAMSQLTVRPSALAPPVARELAGALRLRLRPAAAPDAGLRTSSAAPASLRMQDPAGSESAARRDDYAAVTAALARGDAHALPRLAGLAQAGDARAQLHLAGLYETGASGAPRDLAAARLWTRRAAERGERVAMHNLGLFLTEAGRDAEAAVWFRRAADRGVVDSQYNLGLLYEAGRGVERNLREAYRWFTVAANAGDGGAREKQVELAPDLAGAERSEIDRGAADYRPGLPEPVAEIVQLIPPAETLAETQALLARKGYYVGPVDGVVSSALHTAVAAYLRDHPHAVAEVPGA